MGKSWRMQIAAEQLHGAVKNLAGENALLLDKVQILKSEGCSKRFHQKREPTRICDAQLVQEKRVLKALCKLAVALIIDSLTGGLWRVCLCQAFNAKYDRASVCCVCRE